MSQRRIAAMGFAFVLLYALWIAWPYVASIVVRDAAVTTWVSVIASPIAGYTTNPLYPGMHVGDDGRLATVADEQADMRELAKARAELIHTNANATAQQLYVDAMHHGIEAREKHASGFATTYGQDLDSAITGAKSSLASLQQRLKLARDEAGRLAKLKESGVTTQSALDTAHANVAALEQQIAETNASLARATKRQSASGSGVFLLEDGTNGNSAFQGLADARLRLLQAEALLAQYVAERDAAQAVLDAVQKSYDRARSLDIMVPHNAMVWSLISGPGAPVQPGSPIASWVDCSVMLVDAPVSDVETSLLHAGSPAEVVIEGERHSRHGKVILTRGSAGALDLHDLAAVAKGRHAGLGQAIVKLEPSADDVRRCPIGHAAYVDFPDVGILQVIRGRLRL
jgi:multidrug resistance efflux pump